MSIISEKIIPLLSVYNPNAETIATDRQARSELIHLIGRLYTQITKRHPILDKKYYKNGLSDGYLNEAERVVYKNNFSRFPGSYGRLKPLADEYISRWLQILTDLSQCSTSPMREATLDARIQAFVIAHLAFAHQYVAEYRVCRADKPLAVHLNYPKTIKCFSSFTSAFVAQHLSLGPQIKQLIEISDPKAFLLVPYLVILLWIQRPQSSYPELLQPLEGKIGNLRSSYNQLTPDEKQSLEKELLNENVTFTEGAKQVHLQLSEITYILQSGENAQPFANCFNVFLTALNEDFSIAEKIRPHLNSINLSDIALDTAPGALYVLLHLPLDLDVLFYDFLPTWRQGALFHDKFLTGSPEFKSEVNNFLTFGTKTASASDFVQLATIKHDLAYEKFLYRLFGILQQVFPDEK